MNDRVLGVGVIGLGVGEQHALAFAARSECRLVALCDVNAAKLETVAARFPGARLYPEAEDLIDDPGVQIVSIASYDTAHAEQIIRALRRGKHVFAEKPLCVSAEELRDIRAALCASPELRLSTNTLLRRSPRFRWLKDAVCEGELGTVYYMEADYVYGRLHKLIDGWRGRIPRYSVILGGGIHMVDLVLWIAEQRPIEVVAYGSGMASRDTTFAGNDLVVALLRFESGLIAKIGANFSSIHPHFHHLVAYGTRATFENRSETVSAAGRLWTSRDPQEPPTDIAASYPGVQKGDLVPAFINAVLGRGEPDVAEDEVFAVMTVCLAIDQAVTEARPITIHYD